MGRQTSGLLFSVTTTFLLFFSHLCSATDSMEQDHSHHTGQPDSGFRQTGLERFELKPKMRVEPLSGIRYEVPTKYLIPYLENLVVFEEEVALSDLAYVLGFPSGSIIGGQGDAVYVRGMGEKEVSTYSFLRFVENFHDPVTEESLGSVAVVMGAAELKRHGDPATLRITKAVRPVEKGERLTPRLELNLPEILRGTTPDKAFKGEIISVQNGLWDMGRFSVAIVNLGKRDGLFRGGVLDIVQSGISIVDPINPDETVSLPAEKIGEILVYQAFEKISLGIIMKASRTVLIADVVSSPGTES